MNFNYKVYNLNPSRGGFSDYFSIKLFKGTNKAVYKRIIDGSKQVDVRFVKNKRKFALVTDLNTGNQTVLFSKEKYTRLSKWLYNRMKCTEGIKDLQIVNRKQITRNGKKIKGKKYIQVGKLDIQPGNAAGEIFSGFYGVICGKLGKFGEYLDTIEKSVREYRLNLLKGGQKIEG